MPGLIGIIRKCQPARTGLKPTIARMAAIIRHFPDYRDVQFSFEEGRIQIGLQSITNPSLPMNFFKAEESGVMVFLDGEISNQYELSAEAGCRGEENAARLIGLLFRRQGPQATLERASGWFNLVVFDSRLGRLWLANDRYGIRPLYYHESESSLVFGSEVKAVLAALDETPQLNHEAVVSRFGFGSLFGEDTLFSKIFRFPPGSLWSFDRGSRKSERYWNPSRFGDKKTYTEEEAIEVASELLSKVVARYTRGDLLFSLTGGHDTRLIASFLPSGRNPRLAFSYGMSSRMADAVLAAEVSRKLGIPHVFIPLAREFLAEFPTWAEKAVWFSDGREDVRSASIPYVHSCHRNDIVLGGKYGTQTMRGVHRHIWSNTSGAGMKLFSSEFLETLRRLPHERLEEVRKSWSSIEGKDDRSLMFLVLEECRNYWGGKLAIENALVHIRTPFLDPEFVDWVACLPDRFRHGHGFEQQLIKASSLPLARIPTDRGAVADVGGRRGYGPALFYHLWHQLTYRCEKKWPIAWGLNLGPISGNVTTRFPAWFAGELHDYVRAILLEERTLSRGYFNRGRLKQMLHRHRYRLQNFSAEIATALTFELFLRQFVDGGHIRRLLTPQGRENLVVDQECARQNS